VANTQTNFQLYSQHHRPLNPQTNSEANEEKSDGNLLEKKAEEEEPVALREGCDCSKKRLVNTDLWFRNKQILFLQGKQKNQASSSSSSSSCSSSSSRRRRRRRRC
jgi:hypothetical protein